MSTKGPKPQDKASQENLDKRQKDITPAPAEKTQPSSFSPIESMDEGVIPLGVPADLRKQAAPEKKGLLNVSSEEWLKAEHYFKNYPDKTKMSKPMRGKQGDTVTEHSFIKVEGNIYAIANVNFAGEQDYGLVGEGCFGKVKVVQNQSGDNFAVKIEGRGLRAEDDAELNIMKTIDFVHGQSARNLDQEKKYKDELTSEKLYTVMKLIEGKDLANLIYVMSEYEEGFMPPRITGEKALTDQQKLEIGLKCCKAIQNLHTKGIAHKDIKSANFMVNIKGDTIAVEAIDFGQSKITNKQSSINKDIQSLGFMFQFELQLDKKYSEGMLDNSISLPDVINRLSVALENSQNLKSLMESSSKTPPPRPTRSAPPPRPSSSPARPSKPITTMHDGPPSRPSQPPPRPQKGIPDQNPSGALTNPQELPIKIKNDQIIKKLEIMLKNPDLIQQEVDNLNHIVQHCKSISDAQDINLDSVCNDLKIDESLQEKIKEVVQKPEQTKTNTLKQ